MMQWIASAAPESVSVRASLVPVCRLAFYVSLLSCPGADRFTFQRIHIRSPGYAVPLSLLHPLPSSFVRRQNGLRGPRSRTRRLLALAERIKRHPRCADNSAR
jgi:hypothetical protein